MRLFKIDGDLTGVTCRKCSQHIQSPRGGIYELGQGVSCLKCVIDVVKTNLSEAKRERDVAVKMAETKYNTAVENLNNIKELLKDHPEIGLEI